LTKFKEWTLDPATENSEEKIWINTKSMEKTNKHPGEKFYK
jgi:hypothetical protein